MDFAFSFEIWQSLCVRESKNANSNVRFAIAFALSQFMRCNEDAEAELKSMCCGFLKAVATNRYEKAGRGSKPKQSNLSTYKGVIQKERVSRQAVGQSKNISPIRQPKQRG